MASRELIEAIARWHGWTPALLAALVEVHGAGRGRLGLREENARVVSAMARGDLAEAEFQALHQASLDLLTHRARVRDLAPQLVDAEVLSVALAAYDCGDAAEAVRAHAERRAPRGARAGYVEQVLQATRRGSGGGS